MTHWLLQPSSPQSEPAWSPPDSRRSTLDLLQSCILTLILCSWTAIHQNIPLLDLDTYVLGDLNKRKIPEIKKTDPRNTCSISSGILSGGSFRRALGVKTNTGMLRVEKVGVGKGRTGVSLDGNRTATVQSLPEPNDTAVPPGNPSHGNPETHSTNDQGHNHRDPTKKDCSGRWHFLFPPELMREFYVEMGGFELLSDLGEGRELSDGFRGTVTSRGAIELARVGLLPEVPWRRIKD